MVSFRKIIAANWDQFANAFGTVMSALTFVTPVLGVVFIFAHAIRREPVWAPALIIVRSLVILGVLLLCAAGLFIWRLFFEGPPWAAVAGAFGQMALYGLLAISCTAETVLVGLGPARAVLFAFLFFAWFVVLTLVLRSRRRHAHPRQAR